MKLTNEIVRRAVAAIMYSTFLIVAPSTAWAKLEVKIEPEIKDGEEWIGIKNWCDPGIDAFIARVSDNGKLLTSIEYCATYGKSEAQGFTDKGGRSYVLIERNTVRGTHAVWRDLDVYRVVPDYYDGYAKIMTIPMQEPSGTCQTVRYAYDVGDSPKGGLQLTFVRRLLENCGEVPHNPLMPDKARVILIDVP